MPFMNSDVTHRHFHHTLFVQSRSLSSIHVQGEGNETSRFEGKRFACLLFFFLLPNTSKDNQYDQTKYCLGNIYQAGFGRVLVTGWNLFFLMFPRAIGSSFKASRLHSWFRLLTSDTQPINKSQCLYLQIYINLPSIYSNTTHSPQPQGTTRSSSPHALIRAGFLNPALNSTLSSQSGLFKNMNKITLYPLLKTLQWLSSKKKKKTPTKQNQTLCCTTSSPLQPWQTPSYRFSSPSLF